MQKSSEFRWRLVASNGQTIATGGEGYKSKESAKDGIESVKKNAPIAEIEEK
ncbi:MAG: YegP family protein [Dehalococcoidia bacterium]